MLDYDSLAAKNKSAAPILLQSAGLIFTSGHTVPSYIKDTSSYPGSKVSSVESRRDFLGPPPVRGQWMDLSLRIDGISGDFDALNLDRLNLKQVDGCYHGNFLNKLIRMSVENHQLRNEVLRKNGLIRDLNQIIQKCYIPTTEMPTGEVQVNMTRSPDPEHHLNDVFSIDADF